MSYPFSGDPENIERDTPSQTGDRFDEMRRVAKYQRWVLFAVLANVTLYILFIIASVNDEAPALKFADRILSIIVFFFSIYAIFKLARELFSTGIAVLCAILILVPLVGLITLLVINQKATTYLQRRGVHVGLMGANPNNI
ncbi:DUF805 domain-containing protein [Bythopirellula goksoeyrii]|uniref:Uncharacterized protein n=1 Tax=Bythopirellula goksoeyrii TaxID=1400387 RepID=A0A5B9QUZ8_9BACT|nr:DUF805 domain-containing protein [Bythopirellula goksoeyrii]QEG37763.1 hypothetical protein Pr1d_51100 [Bythopirellula goksoeyrii]